MLRHTAHDTTAFHGNQAKRHEQDHCLWKVCRGALGVAFSAQHASDSSVRHYTESGGVRRKLCGFLDDRP